VEPEEVTSEAHLRPIERRIRRLVAAGVDPAEVAWRFRRSRRSVSQILVLSSRPHREASSSTNPQVLRPLERRILAWREAGASYAELGARFRRSPQFVRRVEDLARAKLARAEKDAHSNQPELQGPVDTYPSF
jgi:DNA-binding CsgD family transcriptional regulator